jgi:site-specific recombinase XerD
MGCPSLNTSPLSQEYELLLADYERYLKRWSFRRVKRRLAVARELLHWWSRPLGQLRPEDLAPYLGPRPAYHGKDVRTFTLFLERMGHLPTPRRPDPADRPLPDVATPASVLVGEFLRARKRQGHRAVNRGHDRSTLGIFLRSLSPECQRDLAQITHHDIEAFIEQQQDRGLAASSINRRLSVVRSFFTWLARSGHYGRDNPVYDDHYLPLPDPLPRAMGAQEVARLLAVINDGMDRALFLVLLRTGIRVGELLRLTVADVDLAQSALYIQQGNKNDRGRVVYLADDARQALAVWLKERQPFNVKPLFFTRRSQGLSQVTVGTRLRRYLKAADIHGPYTVHSLRHTFATDLLNAGVPITTLQELMGHVNITVTQRYARVSDATKRRQYFAAMQQLGGDSPALWPAADALQEVSHGQRAG